MEVILPILKLSWSILEWLHFDCLPAHAEQIQLQQKISLSA